MTGIPESNETSEMAGRDAQDEQSAPVFRPYVPSEVPQKRSCISLVLMILSVGLIIGGLLFWKTEPDEAKGKKAPPNFSKMTAEQLAENASMSAAVELVRRAFHGTPAERSAASRVMSRPRSSRLSRNLAMAMALEQKKRAEDRRVSVEREMRRVEEGY